MVSSQQEEVLWVLDLVSQQQTDCLQALFAWKILLRLEAKYLRLTSIDIIPEEEIVGLRGESAVLEESQQIRVLSMDITYA